ncbi:transposase [Xenorhabdus eapokensis]|uniref:Transposase n=1 Tax=Xenorhabdus eapokensis TaxID=1873482 RepID=A0A1Q5TKW4_9GAMM|nr:transposase [Xenorhabdus eapokensis]
MSFQLTLKVEHRVIYMTDGWRSDERTLARKRYVVLVSVIPNA